MEHDETTQSTSDGDHISPRLLATEDAVLPATDDCTVTATADLGRALTRGATPDVVVLGPTTSAATVTDAIRRLRGGRTRTLLVCQGALPSPTRGSVTTVPGHEDPERAVERAVYLALVEHQREGAFRQVAAESSSADAQAALATVGTQRAVYADRFDVTDFEALYRHL